jgi:hypothetical protein
MEELRIKKRYDTQKTNRKMAGVSPSLPVMTLNINKLSVKRK